MHAPIDFQRHLIRIGAHDGSFWQAYAPRILILTDGLGFQESSGRALSQFVAALGRSTVFGVTPLVITAGPDGVPGGAGSYAVLRPEDSGGGTLGSRYDVVFLFGAQGPALGSLGASEHASLARFMEAGGGVFATGGDMNLGAALCSTLPRVRAMRDWGGPEVSSRAKRYGLTADRRDTGTLPAGDGAPVRSWQRLFPSYYTDGRGDCVPHPLLQAGPGGTIDFFPSPPHANECRTPGDLATRFSLDGDEHDEWPAALGGGTRVCPEGVALAVHRGDSVAPCGAPGASEPRAYLAIAAYDGHRAGVGRVVTSATWHPFVDRDLAGRTTTAILRRAPGTPDAEPPEAEGLQQYFCNLATWLMPQNVRRRLRFLRIFQELVRPPLGEELVAPRLETASGDELREVGRWLVASVAALRPRFEADELLGDALADAVGPAERARLSDLGHRFGRVSASDLGLTALGALTVAVIAKLPALGGLGDLDPLGAFEPVATEAARFGVRRYVESARKELVELDDLLHRVLR